MKDDIDNNEKLFKEFLNLRKYSSTLTGLYTRLMSKNFNFKDWKKERKNIDSDMNRYSKSLEKVEELLHSVNENNNKSKEEIKKIKDQLKTIKNECEPKYNVMEARIENFKEMNNDPEEEEENKDEQNNIKSTDLINSKEISQQINDSKEDLDRRIANENEDKEKPLLDDEKNEEKKEDKEQERNDNKKRCLGIEWTRNKIIVTALIAIVIIAVVVVIIVFCSK